MSKEDGWDIDGARMAQWLVSGLLSAGATILLALGYQSCQRTRAFEDACRAAGGIPTTLANLGLSPGPPSTDVCVSSFKPPVFIPVKVKP